IRPLVLEQHGMAMAAIHVTARGLRQPAQAEGAVEFVEQARVVGIAHVLEIELPVRGHPLPLIAEKLDGLAEALAEVFDEQRAEVTFQRLGCVAERAEDDAVPPLDAERLQTMLSHVEVGRHATAALDTPGERNADEIAAVAVAPIVIDAGEI